MEENRMLSDEILLALIKKNSGGGGGTSDYENLSNQPQINGNTLIGNKTASDLGLVAAETGKGLSENNYTNEDKAIVGGVTEALADKQGVLTEGDYVSIDARNNISVNRELTPHQTSYRIKGTGQYTMNITKYIDGVQESSTDYRYSQGTTRTIDDAFTVNDAYDSSDGYIWQFVWLKDSTTHDKDYVVAYRAYNGDFDFTEVFDDEDLSGYKLVIKSEMDTALANKQDKTDNNLQTTDKTVVGGINELESGLTNLDNEVNGDATTYPYADVINVEDAVPANLADCSVKVEPVQDLHGYDKPWVGGAGKNKFNLDLITQTVSGVTITVNGDGTFSTNGTASADININILGYADTVEGATYKLNGCPSGGGNNTYKLVACDVGGGAWYSDTGDGVSNISYDRVKKVKLFIASGANVSGKTFKPMVYLNSETDATFAPYTNICPINGHTEAVVTQLDKNWFDYTKITVNSRVDITNGTIQTHEQLTQFKVSDYTEVLAQKTYILNFTYMSGADYGMAFYDENKAFLSGCKQRVNEGDTTFSFTTPSKCKYIRFTINDEIDPDDIQLELGTVCTKFEKFVTPKQYTLALGDTIYGGTVDFETGVMNVTYRVLGLSDTYNYTTPSYPSAGGLGFASWENTGAKLNGNGLCNFGEVDNANAWFATVPTAQISFNSQTVGRIRFYCDAANNTEFESKYGDLQICYELATPFTVQFTPQQIQLLKGTNTLYASTGDISVSVNGVSGSIGQVQEQVNELTKDVADVQSGLSNKIGYIRVDVSGTEINNQESGWYYANINLPTLPSGAVPISVYFDGGWDVDVFYSININTVIARCLTSKTIGTNNRYIRVLYYIP